MRQTKNHADPRAEKKAALLDAMIDEELSRPDEEQDPDAVAEWSGMIDELTDGAYRPTRGEKRRLLKVMKDHRRARGRQDRPDAAKRKCIRAAAAAIAVLAVLLLPAGVWAGKIRTALDDLLLRLKPQLSKLEEGESLVVHTENADYLFVGGGRNTLGSPEELADFIGHPVLWPDRLPDGVEAGEIRLNCGVIDNYVLIPLQNGYSFLIEISGIRERFPKTKTVTAAGEEAELLYYLNDDGSGGGNFFHAGVLYTVHFPSLEDGERFLEGLTEVKG